MINKDIITLNECTNDGSSIHLYFNSDIGAWTAYGFSAYGLRLFCKTKGISNIRCYSKDMQMPCTMAQDDEILEQINQFIDTKASNTQHILMQFTAQIDMMSYKTWTDKLKGIPLIQEEVVEELELTPVSKFVSKTEFIPDGMSAFARNTKRIVDCFLAFISLIIFSPLFIICWIAVRLEDRGPAIYKQQRIGRFGRPFNIYKFRSMRMDAEKFGPQLSFSGGENDPRLTQVGKFLRAYHLDELPQLWNVFKGDMAFIGPRPERKFYIDQILERDKRYRFLYQIRPGVTSYATLYNGYTDTIDKMLRRLEYDLYYLDHRSWLFDFKILFMTFCKIVFGRKF